MALDVNLAFGNFNFIFALFALILNTFRFAVYFLW